MHDPAAVTAQIGPDFTASGFADGEFLTYGYDVPDEVTAVPGVNITGHVKSVNRAGFVQLVFHFKSKSLKKLNAMRKAAAAPGANVKFTLIVADLSGLSIVKLTGARFQSRPGGSYATTGPSSRTFRFHGELLEVDELGFPED